MRRWVAGVAVLAVMLSWALATARYGGPDEPAHVLRAAAVADGELRGDRVAWLVPGYRMVTVPAALATGDPICFRRDGELPATCARPAATPQATVRAATAVASNPPPYYAVVGLLVRLTGGVDNVLWYRVMAAALCAMVLVLALHRASPIGVAPVVIIALSPACWFLFGVVNPNALEIELVALAWVGVERCRVRASGPRSELWWIAIPLGIAIAFRPVAAIAVVAMLAVLLANRVRLPWRSWAILACGPLAGAASVAAWALWNRIPVEDSRTASRRSFASALWRSIGNTTDTAREMAGSLGWLEFSAPNGAQAVWWLAIAAAAFGVRRLARPLRVSWVLIATSIVLTPITFEMLFRMSVGLIWQGRYSVSTAIGLVIVGSAQWWPRMARGARLALLAAAGVAEVATLWTALRRYSVGTNGSWWLRDAAWHPPLPAVVLALMNAAGMAVVSVLALRNLAAHHVEGAAGLEPLDLFGAERVHALEVQR